MYLIIVITPLISSLIVILSGRYLTPRGSVLFTTCCIFFNFILSCVAFYEVALSHCPVYFKVFSWLSCEMLDFSWGFMFDTLTVTMLVIVNCVSTVVHAYSIDYMETDPHKSRFFSYLSLFTFFMLVLVTADNFVQMFVGWEGVGLCSYLLINFWHTRLQANKAAMKAVFVNRVGDFGLLMGIFLIFWVFKTVNYLTFFALVPFYSTELNYNLPFFHSSIDVLTLICFFLFVGVMGKSAQIGLHTWLPDAMEGPTPVSALIHAATMVTAGVFLLARCSPLFEYSSDALALVTFFGAMTAFFASATATVQNDLKRVIAYSTCSQLGYMVFACGTSNYTIGIFHLSNHAFFKALLFLSAGSVIHSLFDEQDMRKMGGLIKVIPFTYSMIFVGSLSLMGFPFLTGFYSKDAILEFAFAKFVVSAHFAYWLGVLSAFFTSFYSMRLIYLTFWNKTNAYRFSIQNVHDLPKRMAGALIILIFSAIFIGYLTFDMAIGVGTDFWGNSILTLPHNVDIFNAEFLPASIKLIPVIFSCAGILSSLVVYRLLTPRYKYLFKQTSLGLFLYRFFNKKWFFDKIYNEIFGQSFLYLGYNSTYKMIDRGLLEFIGPHSISKIMSSSSFNAKNSHTGLVYHSILFFFGGLLVHFFLLGVFTSLTAYVDFNLIFVLLVAFVLILYKEKQASDS
jgi:NADH-ubiquinone oxidoreductase chain 5